MWIEYRVFLTKDCIKLNSNTGKSATRFDFERTQASDVVAQHIDFVPHMFSPKYRSKVVWPAFKGFRVFLTVRSCIIANLSFKLRFLRR